MLIKNKFLSQESVIVAGAVDDQLGQNGCGHIECTINLLLPKKYSIKISIIFY